MEYAEHARPSWDRDNFDAVDPTPEEAVARAQYKLDAIRSGSVRLRPAGRFVGRAVGGVFWLLVAAGLLWAAYEFVTDRAGPGKFRGGVPYRREYKFLEREAVLQVRSDRRETRPYGLYGGRPGRPSRNVLNPAGEARDLDSKLIMNLQRGDVFLHELPGGGGWGDPLERDPEHVLEDVRNEFVSVEGAARDYGVVVRTESWTVDHAASAKRRQALRESRPTRADAPVLREDDVEPLGADW